MSGSLWLLWKSIGYIDLNKGAFRPEGTKEVIMKNDISKSIASIIILGVISAALAIGGFWVKSNTDKADHKETYEWSMLERGDYAAVDVDVLMPYAEETSKLFYLIPTYNTRHYIVANSDSGTIYVVKGPESVEKLFDEDGMAYEPVTIKGRVGKLSYDDKEMLLEAMDQAGLSASDLDTELCLEMTGRDADHLLICIAIIVVFIIGAAFALRMIYKTQLDSFRGMAALFIFLGFFMFYHAVRFGLELFMNT